MIIGLLIGGLVMYLAGSYGIEKRSAGITAPTNCFPSGGPAKAGNEEPLSRSKGNSIVNIARLTDETAVINYVKSHRELPDCYITKAEARKHGWNPSAGNLCDVLPGRAIGGDRFSNREKNLPAGRQYFEADVNYACGNRNTDRVVFTRSGEVYLTKNHYKSFQKQ